LNGLFEALSFFELKEGTIVTFNQSDTFERDGLIAQAVPCHVYLREQWINKSVGSQAN